MTETMLNGSVRVHVGDVLDGLAAGPDRAHRQAAHARERTGQRGRAAIRVG